MTYEKDKPATYILLTSLNVMLPFILYAALSFVVAVFSSRFAKETDKKEANATAKTEAD
jgi:membrane protein implicated in regulation of membrane protease activity